jgi:hypothetical protein
MVKVDDVFGSSNYLKAADLDGGEETLTIKAYSIKEYDEVDRKTGETYKSKKAVFEFEGTDKLLVCNKTNRNAIQYAYGDEMDDWVGKEITLFPQMVDFAGKQVEAIRVRVIKPKKTSSLLSKKSSAKTDLNDEVPF